MQSIVRPFCTAQCALDCIGLDKHRDFSENIAMVRERQHLLTKDEITAFSEIGWIAKKALFHADEINKMRACFENLERMAANLDATGLHEGSHFVLGSLADEPLIKRVIWAGGSQPYLLEVGEDPRLTQPCAQLLGSNDMEQLLSQAHFKRPGDGVIFGWHQDIQHRDKGGGTWTDVNGSGSVVQTLIVIDAMTPDSGPLQFIPGSSAWGRVDFGHHDYDNPDYESTKPPQFHEEDVITITAAPGDALFFGPYAAHASFENTSDSYRRVLINGYAYPGANGRIYPGSNAGRTVSVS